MRFPDKCSTPCGAILNNKHYILRFICDESHFLFSTKIQKHLAEALPSVG
uniref:Uncharacterized protein n=1 Tax=Klebsiella pneumoniae TaxID=573 RepID=A0A3G1IEB3_KLEPN|nr:hypothetical protein pPUTH1_0263 [Klebsiella pneumoniae]URZ91744.1 hypothetical protein [Klebsiella pneumoniae]URZ93552.1 hypothetical protein [Klebsiella pneumoniae]